MHSFKRGRVDTWVLVVLSGIILSALGKILWDNNHNTQAFSSLSGQTTYSSEALDSTCYQSQAAYAPPDQPSSLGKKKAISSQEVELSSDYVGAPKRLQYQTQPKLQRGQQIDLNSADTLTLQQVPGIGPSFARRIARYRDRLGGYYTVLQLQEVFGMDPERYQRIKPYFYIGIKPYSTPFQLLRSDSIPTHPYLNYRQQTALIRNIQKNGALDSWHRIMSLDEFNRDDSIRLSHYFHFE